ncbi:MAG TPA: transporter substrate-binding domain-containing protein [Burkholderiaceae bacterium]|jgi:polar amino acid transport system substrate-binding protein
MNLARKVRPVFAKTNKWLVGIGILLGAAHPASAQDTAAWHFVTEPFPPYTYELAGRGAGPMVDVLNTVCARLKQACRVDVMPWRRALAMAVNGEVDGVFTVADTPERRAVLYVSAPVVEAQYAFFALAGNPFEFSRPNDLSGRTVGVYGPSATSSTLQSLLGGKEADMVIEIDNRTVLRKLRAGRYGPDGLALVNERVAQDLIERESLSGLRQAGTTTPFSYHFGFSRKHFDAANVTRFDQVVDDLCRSGRLQDLLNAYGMRAPTCRN